MRFLKEIIAIVLIVTFLIVSDAYISNFTEKSIKEIEGKTDYVLENILSKENYVKEEELKKIENFQKDWKKIEDKLAYFAEHEELEKVSVTIAMMKANVEADMREDAYEKMKEIKFRIDHIKSKQKLKLNNIF